MTNVPARVERRLPVFIFAQPFWTVCTALTPAELIKLAPCKLRMLDDDGLFAWKSSCNTSFAVPVCASVPGETVLGNIGAPPASQRLILTARCRRSLILRLTRQSLPRALQLIAF